MRDGVWILAKSIGGCQRINNLPLYTSSDELDITHNRACPYHAAEGAEG